MSRTSATRVKDVLLEHVSRDIKELQKAQSDIDNAIDIFTNSETQSQTLCDHLDHILMHGVREFENGYWPFVSYFTRNELVQSIADLKQVTTNVGKGRSWLYTALNEQSMESYVRMFAENQNLAQEFYFRDAFMRDVERLLLLLTLVSGLDFISFGLHVDCDYLDYGASEPSSRLSLTTTAQRTPDVQPSFLSQKVCDREETQQRRNSDPSPKTVPALPTTSDDRESRDFSASYAGTGMGGSSDRHTELPSESHAETESGKPSSGVPQNPSEGLDTPPAVKPHPPMMSSSSQMTSSQMNFLERMGSLDSRSPFMERKSLVDEGRRKVEHGGGSEKVRVVGGERGRGEGEGSGDEVLVARGRRGGRGKKKRRKKREEGEEMENPEKTGASLTRTSPRIRSSQRDHVIEEQSHVTEQQSHVTAHVIKEGEEEQTSEGLVEQQSVREQEIGSKEENKVSPDGSFGDEKEMKQASKSLGDDCSSKEKEERERDVSIPIPRGSDRFPGLEECDFETEPRSPVVGRGLEARLVRRGEGERDGRGGKGMSLEMELALAARDIDSPVESEVVREEEGSESRMMEGGGGPDRERSAEGKSDSVLPLEQTETETERQKKTSGDGDGGHLLEQFHSPPEVNLSPFEVVAKERGSPDWQQSPPDAENPFGDEHSPSLSPPPTINRHQKHTRHTSPAHLSRTLEHPHSKMKIERDPRKSKSKSPKKSGSRKPRDTSPDFEGDFDVITKSEMREVSQRRGRANAVFQEEGTVERERDPPTNLKKMASTTEVEEAMQYEGPPRRPQHITEQDKTSNDVKIDETMKVVFSLDVFLPDKQATPPPSGSSRQQRPSQHTEEDAKRLVQVNTAAGLGQYRTGYVLVTTEAVYLLRRDGIEGLFSREFGVRYSDIDHLVVGLGWQSIELVFRDSSTTDTGSGTLQSCVVLTGSEAVSRSLMASIQEAATKCPGFYRVLPKNRDDESRIEAIERELIKLGSETSMDIMQYSLINWEQVKGESPEFTSELSSNRVTKNGVLQCKSSSVLGLSLWKQAFFELRNGTLYQYTSETDKVSRASFPLAGSAGCKRVSGESKMFVLSVTLDNAQPLLLAATNEEELTQWIQALCEAMIQVPSKTNKCLCCAALVTKSKVHILQEDLSSGTVNHVTCCEVTAVEEVGINRELPLYCTISYDDGERCKGVWLLCFNSEYELAKFETALASLWREEFQINLPFSEVKDIGVRQRAHHAVDLMQASHLRSDSITRGRTEFSYSLAY